MSREITIYKNNCPLISFLSSSDIGERLSILCDYNKKVPFTDSDMLQIISDAQIDIADSRERIKRLRERLKYVPSQEVWETEVDCIDEAESDLDNYIHALNTLYFIQDMVQTGQWYDVDNNWEIEIG